MNGFGHALFAVVTLLSTDNAIAVTPAGERIVLLEIYNGTDGSHWTNKSGWNGPEGTECSWFGINCDASSHVQSINLSGNNLVGVLPASLTNLPYLVTFDASNNGITGAIPAVAGLMELQTFAVSFNQLSGQLPSLGNLSNLRNLIVAVNNLSGNIPSLSGLTNLQTAWLAYNKFNGNIPALTALPNLKNLWVDNNQLEGTIPPLTDLTSLLSINVDHNALRGLPPDLPMPSSLSGATLCPNYLDHVPSSAWDALTGKTPWYQNCPPLPDPVFANGFDAQ